MHDYPLTYSSPREVGLRRLAHRPLFGLGRVVATPDALDSIGIATHVIMEQTGHRSSATLAKYIRPLARRKTPSLL